MSVQTPAQRTSLVPPSTTRFDRVVRSEVVKMFSLRSTGWTLLAMVVVTVGFGMLICWGVSQGSPEDQAGTEWSSLPLTGLGLGQLALAVLGAMTVSTEYTTGGIRSTLTAVPARLRLLSAKGLVFLVVAIVVGLVVCFAAFEVARLFIDESHRPALGDPDVPRLMVGGALYVAGSGMYGFAFGALLRQTAAAITAAVAFLIVLPPLSQLLPGDWGDWITNHFTSNAGLQVMSTVPPSGGALGVWEGYLWFTLEWVVLLVVAAVLLVRRDA